MTSPADEQSGPSSENDAKYLEDVKELVERSKLKEALMKSNQNAQNSQLDESSLHKLDSSLKRNTAFVRKLRTITDSQKNHIMEECQQLNLSKYLAEVCNALVDAKLKLADVPFVLRLCSELHQRYAEFGTHLLEKWKKNLPSPNSKDLKISGGPSKYRFDLRLFADLNAISIFPQPDGMRTLGTQLRWLTTSASSAISTSFESVASNDSPSADDTLAQVITFVTAFCKYCGDDWMGFISQNLVNTAEKHGVSLPSCKLISEEHQQKIRQLLQDFYTNTVCARVLSLYQEVRRQERANMRQLQNRGEVPQERQDSLQNVATAYNKLYTCTCTLADYLHVPLPQLPKEQHDTEEEMPGIIDVDRLRPDKLLEYEGEKSLFEDEETRQFYENLPDLKAMLPAIICSRSTSERDKESPAQDKKSDVSESQADGTAGLNKEEMIDSATIGLEDIETLEKELEQEEQRMQEEEQQELSAGGAVGEDDLSQVDASTLPDAALPDEAASNQEASDKTPLSQKTAADVFLTNLSNCVNRDMIDKVSMEFCLSFNTRTNRRKLARTICGVHRNRIDLIPFYARLVATLKPLMPDLVEDVNAILLKEARTQIAKKDQIYLESKLKTMRLIGEMVKFSVMPCAEALRLLKSLLVHFSHHQIDMTCVLLETCGRFLYRSPASHHRTRVLLEIMMRKKALLLDQRQVVMIENAYYYSNPPSTNNQKVVAPEELLPAPHEYMRHLLLSLHRGNVDRNMLIFQKLDWDDSSLYSFALQCFSSPWLLRFNCLRQLAQVLSSLAIYHPSHERLAVDVVDNLLEDVRRCMEINLPKLNQRRLTVLKFIGYLYEYRLVEADVIFDLLYCILTYGSFQQGDVLFCLDPPEHLFRINMICTLLDSTAHFFTTGSLRKKLTVFLKYFQRYFWYKRSHPIYIQSVESKKSEENEGERGDCVASATDSINPLTNQPTAIYYFPMQVEQLYFDTIESLEVNFRPVKSYSEAVRVVQQMETQYKNRLKRSKIGKELFRNVRNPGLGFGRESLTAISESDSRHSFSHDGNPSPLGEEQEGSESDKDSLPPEASQRLDDDSNGEGEEDTTEEKQGPGTVSRYMEEDGNLNQNTGQSSERDPCSGKAQERSTRLRFIDCVEDEEFRNMLDHMANETVQSRSIPQTNPSNFTGQFTIPLAIRSIQKRLEEQKKVPNWLPQDAIPFTLLTRPGAAASASASTAVSQSTTAGGGGIPVQQSNPGAQAVFIPKDSSFVNHFMHMKAQEEAEHAQMKKLVLQMHKTQLQEDEENLEQATREKFPNVKFSHRVGKGAGRR